jgi:hypothetical protein
MNIVAPVHGDESVEPPAAPPTSSLEAELPDSQVLGSNSASDRRTAAAPKVISSGEPVMAEAAANLPQVLKIVGAVVAPTTLLTALMYYFGRQWANGFFRYLGVQFTVMDLTVQDYLIRSVDGLINPLIVIAGIALMALWFHQLKVDALPAKTRRAVLRVLMRSAAVAGSLIVSLALADLRTPVFPAAYPELRGLGFSIGVLLLAYTVRLLRLLRVERGVVQLPPRASATMIVAEWAALFVLVSVGLFWAVGDYANLVGLGRAQEFEAELQLPGSADVVVYSEKRLGLPTPGARELSCQFKDAAYRFRYEGLRLVLQSGNQYLFLPSGWTHADGSAILLPRNETIRLEFSPGGQARNASC